MLKTRCKKWRTSPAFRPVLNKSRGEAPGFRLVLPFLGKTRRLFPGCFPDRREGRWSYPLFTPSFQHSTFLFHSGCEKPGSQTRFHQLSTNHPQSGGKAKPLSGKGKIEFSTESPPPTTFTATSSIREVPLPSLPIRKKTGFEGIPVDK